MKKIISTLLITSILCLSAPLGVFAETKAEPAEAAEETAEEISEETFCTVEGEGFETQEEAVSSYIIGLIDGSVEEMLAACAVETYVDNYDPEKQIARNGALMPPTTNNFYLPAADPLSRELNIETRRAALASTMKFQYLNIIKSAIVSPEFAGKPLPLKDFDSAADMLGKLYSDEPVEIEYTGMIIPAGMITDKFYTYQMQLNIARAAYADNAQQLSSVAAILFVNDEPYLLTLGTERYNDRWYVTGNNMLASVLGLNILTGGMCSVTEALGLSREEVEELYDELLSDGEYIGLMQKLNGIIGDVDIDAIFSLPDDQVKGAFEEAYQKVVYEELTEEERQYIEEMSRLIRF